MQTRRKPSLTPPPKQKKIQTIIQQETTFNYKFPELSEIQIQKLNQIMSDNDEDLVLFHLSQLVNKNNIKNLHTALQQLPKEDSLNFIQITIKQMAKISLNYQNILPQNFPLLLEERTLTFTRYQALCFIALSFFNLLQPQKSSPHYLPSPQTFTFILQENSNDSRSAQKVEKLKCFISYFNQACQLSSTKKNQFISFRRLQLNPIISTDSKNRIGKVQINRKERIEGSEGALFVDFAHSLIGGGTLTNGCVQEEIMFLTHPECLLSIFFTSRLRKDEAILLQNMIQFNEYTGYALSFKHKPCAKQKSHNIVAIDAKEFTSDISEQYHSENILREFNKARVGFSLDLMSLKEKNIATGNWGCGAFKGDPQLKFLIQLLAFSSVNKDGILIYCSFEEKLGDELEQLYQKIIQKFKTVEELFKWVFSGIDQFSISKL